MTSRELFEQWILQTVKAGRPWLKPWSPIEPSMEGYGYLDLYTQMRWEGWQACEKLAVCPKVEGA